MKNIRIGVINWDASLTKDTYFGFYQIRSLSQAKYRTWVPFYAELLDSENIDYRWRTVEEYERELRYAIKAGIDYFAFVWYPTEGSLLHTPQSPNDCSHRVHELNYARRLYEQSSLKDQIGMCAVVSAHPFTDNDLEELINAFSLPYYEKIDGRPLLYVYRGYREEMIARIHSLCKTRNIPIPFTVPMSSNPYDLSAPMPLADALSAYAAHNKTDITRYEELCRVAMENDRLRLATGKKIVPLFSVGWNPAPRMERLTPWTTDKKGETHYAKVQNAPSPNEMELIFGAKEFSYHIKNDVKDRFVGHILTFAWNEFEEGGYICPTYTNDGRVDDSRIHAFAQAVKIFRSQLEQG